MEKIEVAKNGFKEKEEKILNDAKRAVSKIAKGMSNNLEVMGKSLADANAIVCTSVGVSSLLNIVALSIERSDGAFNGSTA